MGGLLYLKPGYETDEGVAKDKVFFAWTGNRNQDQFAIHYGL